MSDKKELLAARVVTGKMMPRFRVAFAQVFEPKSFEGQDPKYSLTMLFPKDADLTALKRVAHAAKIQKWGAKEKWPKNLRSPFRDGDEKQDYEGFENHYYVTATNKEAPSIVDGHLDPITSESKEFYSGCYAKAKLCAFAYDTAGNKGVSFALWAVQKVADGEPFGGGHNLEDAFDRAKAKPDDNEEFNDTENDEDIPF